MKPTYIGIKFINIENKTDVIIGCYIKFHQQSKAEFVNMFCNYEVLQIVLKLEGTEESRRILQAVTQNVSVSEAEIVQVHICDVVDDKQKLYSLSFMLELKYFFDTDIFRCYKIITPPEIESDSVHEKNCSQIFSKEQGDVEKVHVDSMPLVESSVDTSYTNSKEYRNCLIEAIDILNTASDRIFYAAVNLLMQGDRKQENDKLNIDSEMNFTLDDLQHSNDKHVRKMGKIVPKLQKIFNSFLNEVREDELLEWYDVDDDDDLPF